MDRGVLLAKLGIKQAYKMIPVYPISTREAAAWHKWECVYIDKALPLLLRSALIIFTAVADALHIGYIHWLRIIVLTIDPDFSNFKSHHLIQ